jgi:hypothetical protein
MLLLIDSSTLVTIIWGQEPHVFATSVSSSVRVSISETGVVIVTFVRFHGHNENVES